MQLIRELVGGGKENKHISLTRLYATPKEPTLAMVNAHDAVMYIYMYHLFCQLKSHNGTCHLFVHMYSIVSFTAQT